MKRQLIWTLGLVTAMWMLSACSVDGSITDGTQRVYSPSMGQLTGLVSGSYQNITTSSGYKVSATVGSPFVEPAANKTDTGYTVYSSIQGNINSETYDVYSH